MASELVFDTGALIAAERGTRQFQVLWTDVARRGIVPVIPAPVITQYWRGGAGPQARAAKVIRSCEVASVNFELAKDAGELLGTSSTRDAVDAIVVTMALQFGAFIVTSDPGDIKVLLGAAGSRLNVITL